MSGDPVTVWIYGNDIDGTWFFQTTMPADPDQESHNRTVTAKQVEFWRRAEAEWKRAQAQMALAYRESGF